MARREFTPTEELRDRLRAVLDLPVYWLDEDGVNEGRGYLVAEDVIEIMKRPYSVHPVMGQLP